MNRCAYCGTRYEARDQCPNCGGPPDQMDFETTTTRDERKDVQCDRESPMFWSELPLIQQRPTETTEQ